MNVWHALFIEEIRARRLLLPVALGVGLLPLVLESMPVGRRFAEGDLRDSTALVLSGLLATGVAVVLGATMLVRDLGEGRLSFYYARPLKATTLWWGKLGASLFLVLASGLAVWVPTLIAGGDMGRFFRSFEESLVQRALSFPDDLGARVNPPNTIWWESYWMVLPEAGPARPWILAVLALLAVVATSHVVATMLRSRGPFLLFDLVLSSGTALLLGAVVSRAIDTAAWPALVRGMALAPLVLAGAGCLAGIAQQQWGRTVVHRSHRMLSLVFWVALLAASSFYALWVGTGEHRMPEDFEEILHFEPGPSGEWQLVAGRAGSTGHLPTYAHHPASGRIVRLPMLQRLGSWPRIAAERPLVVWSQCPEKRRQPCEVVVRHLEHDAEPRVVATAHRNAELALDARGERLAIFEAGRVSFWDTERARLIATQTFESECTWGRRRLAPDGTVELICVHRREGVPRVEFWRGNPDDNPDRGLLERLAQHPGFLFDVAPDWSRAAVWDREEIVLWEGLGEQPLFALDIVPAIRRLRFLGQGRFAVVEDGLENVGQTLRILASDGSELHAFHRHLGQWYPGNEPVEGWLLAGVATLVEGEKRWAGNRQRSVYRWETLLIDLETGEVLETYPGRYPRPQSAVAGSPESRLLFSQHGRPEQLDPSTLETTAVVLGGQPSEGREPSGQG